VLGAAGIAVWDVQVRPTYRTQVGEQRLIVLSDGSRLRLNTDTAVRVRFGPEARRVELQRGEAFFEVAHDTARPFFVQSRDAEVRAVGTRFDVRREADAVKVTLLEGRVEVTRDGAAATLQPNQQLAVTRQGLSPAVAADAAEVASWTGGRLTFRGLPLGQAVQEVNRYSRRRIILEGPADLAHQPVSGAFDVGDTQAFVAAVTAVFDLQAAPAEDGDIRLKPRA
jgi:transmembrane sensor